MLLPRKWVLARKENTKGNACPSLHLLTHHVFLYVKKTFSKVPKTARFLKKVSCVPKYTILRAFAKRLAYSELKNIDKSCPVIYAYLPRNLCQITG